MNGQRYQKFVASLVLAAFVLLMMACGVDTDVATIDVAKDVAAKANETSVKAPTSELISTQEMAKLLLDSSAAGDTFGYSVALSEDGLTAAIGAPYNGARGIGAGAAFIYEKTTNGWVRQTRLFAGDPNEGAFFGSCVTLFDDTLVVGAHGDSDLGPESGAAYVFERNGSTWTQKHKFLRPNGTSFEHFGFSCAIHGNRFIVGAPAANEFGTASGAAVAYQQTGTMWQLLQLLTAADGRPGQFFGSSVAMTQDTIVIGAPSDNDLGPSSGAAYIFNNGQVINTSAKLHGDDTKLGDHYGYSVAVNGSRVIVGAPGADMYPMNETGAAYVYDSGGFWHLVQKLAPDVATVNDSALFGYAVAIAGDSIVVGAPGADPVNFAGGAAYVFKDDGITWTQQDKLIPATAGTSDHLGGSVAMAGDTILAGQTNSGGTSTIGTVSVFENTGPHWNHATTLTITEAIEGASAVALSEDMVLIGVPHDDDLGPNAGAVFMYTRKGTEWLFETKIRALDGAPDHLFGTSMHLEKNQLVIGAPGADGSIPKTGAVYVFKFEDSKWTFQSKLHTADVVTGAEFGASVGLSGDTMLLSATNASATFVYVLSGSNWVQQAKLNHGGVVALSGNRALIGEPKNSAGKAYLFERTDGSWDEKFTFENPTASDAFPVKRFANAVALSNDIAIIGHESRNATYWHQYDANADQWISRGELTQFGAIQGGGFGHAVSLLRDTLVISAPTANAHGLAYMYMQNDAHEWIPNGKFDPSDQPGSIQFGQSVALADDASSVVFGAPLDGEFRSGAAYLYAIARSLGERCLSAAACESGQCVDGVCCNSPCDGPCQACSAALQQSGADGYCGPVKDGDSGGDCQIDTKNPCGNTGYCKAGTCELQPFDNQLKIDKPICLGNQRYEKQTCNGNGDMFPNLDTSETCGGYKCLADKSDCRENCTKANESDDCVLGFKCVDNQCVASAECKTIADCKIGDVCDEQTKRCIPKELAITPDVYDDACACSLPGQTSNNPAKPMLALALLALLRRRKLHS